MHQQQLPSTSVSDLNIPVGSKFCWEPNLELSCFHTSFPFPGPGLEELHVSHIPAADPRPCVADVPSRGSQYHVRNNSDSSTSSEEGYCNDPSSKPPPWNSQAFYSEKSPLTEQPPNLELAGSPAVFSGNCVSFHAPNPVSNLPRKDIEPNPELLAGCVTLDKSPSLSGPSFPHLSSFRLGSPESSGLLALGAHVQPGSWQRITSSGLPQGPQPMTAPAPHPESGTRTSSHHPSILQQNSLNVQVAGVGGGP